MYSQQNMNLEIEIWSLFCMDLKEKKMKNLIYALPQYLRPTKLGRLLTCSGGTPPSKLHDLLVTWSSDKFKKLIPGLPQYLWPPKLAG